MDPQNPQAPDTPSIAQQMLQDGSLPDKPVTAVPMRAVFAAASTMNPDAEARTQQLATRAGFGTDLVRANPQVAQQRASMVDLDRRNLEITNPILARQLEDPNFAGVAHDDLDSLSSIGQHASTLRAYTPSLAGKVGDALQSAYTFMRGGDGAVSLKERAFEYAPARVAVGAVRGTEETLGNVGSFVGIHGNNPAGLNWLQRKAQALDPSSFGAEETGLDKLAANVGPMIPALMATGGTSLIARTLGMSDKAAKILAALSVGSMFTADQGGGAYSQMLAAGKSEADARHAANVTAGFTALPNLAMGFTDLVPGLRNYPLLASLGVGGAAGAAGRVAQNYVTDQPFGSDVVSSAVQGAAIQGGFHLGSELVSQIGETADAARLRQSLNAAGGSYHGRLAAMIDAVEGSKLRARSPEIFQGFMDGQFAGDASLRVSAQEFVNYFVDKNVNPTEMASRVGVKNLPEAAAVGADLEIPTANYFARLDPESQRGLLQDVVDPSTEMTQRQAATGRQELEDWVAGGGVEKLHADFAAADAETQATPEWKKVYADLKQRYVDAGEAEPAADSYATLQANAIANLAKRAGLKADELLALHNPQVVAGEAPSSGQPRFQDAIDGIRSVVEAAKQEGHAPQKATIAPAEPWLVEAAKEHGLDLADHNHVIDGSAVRHVINRHSNEKIEVSRGQLPVTDADFDRIPELIDSPDAVVFGTKTRGKRDQVGYIKRLEDGSTLYLEEVRTGRKELAAVSMRKYPAAKDFDSIAGTLPSNARSDGGNEPILVLNPSENKAEDEAAPGETLYQDVPENLDIPAIMAAHTDSKGLRQGAAADDLTNKVKEALDAGKKVTLYSDGKPVEIVAINRGMMQDAKGQRWGTLPLFTDPDAKLGNRVEISSPQPAKQSTAEGKRGWFRVLPDGRYEIGKTKLGDFSTFIHEPAHAYLELFRELTQREGASDELKGDFKKIAEWLGTTPEDAYKNGFTREQHEQWARANEQYVREGKAPTSGLERAFHNFATWLGSIYRRAGALGVEMNSDIRGVMDRLYAGDTAVDRAEQEAGREQLFESPEEAGWTEEEFRNYARGRGVEETEARKLILSEMRDAAKRERTDSWRTEKSSVRDAITAEVDQRPEYRAIRSLRKGALDDGTALSLNRDALIKQFGEQRVKDLQQLHRGLYRQEGGTDAETAADLLGFDSGEEMMRALEKAPRRGLAIEQAVRGVMTERHGDIRYDGSLDDKARLAVENNERAKNVHKELAALQARVAVLEKRAADAKAAMRSIAIEPLEHYQEAARQMVDDKAIADLQPHRYLTASRKFSREAFEALRKGNVKAAAAAKNKELLNHFLFREASAAHDYVEKFEKYTQRVQSKGIQQRLGLADENAKREGRTGDYRDQFNWLMARYRLGPSPEAPERSLRDWADDAYGVGNEVSIPPQIFNESRFVDYRNAPLSEVRDLHDALVNVRHLALREFQAYVQGKQVKFAEAKQAMIEAARANMNSKPEQIFDENRGFADRIVGAEQYTDSFLGRPERWVEWLDGGKVGPWHDNLWNLASSAQGDEYALQEKVTKVVGDALSDMPEEMRRRLWTEKVTVDGIGEPLTRRRMLSIAFNMGNEGNLDRLQKTFDAFGWDRGAIRKIGGMLTREEWGFVQKAWESLKPMGERMRELEQRLTGLPPQMVKVTPLKVALDDGTEMDLDGGYFPIAMDPRFSERAIQQDAQQTAQNAMQSGYVRATTSKGYTKERTGFGGPLLLDYEQVLTSHVSKVAKDLSHREFMLAAQRFLLDTDVRKALRETLGQSRQEQFMPWLRTIINDNNGSVQERLDGIKGLMQKARSNFVVSSLSFNPGTLLLQISHAPRMSLYAKPRVWLSRSSISWLIQWKARTKSGSCHRMR
jgi:hypothetical protein